MDPDVMNGLFILGFIVGAMIFGSIVEGKEFWNGFF